MSEIISLDSKLEELFFLKESQFDPEIHFGRATDIVAATKSQVDQTLKITDLFKWRKPLTPKSSHRVGGFLVEGISRLPGATLYGFYPKLEITPWETNLTHRHDASTPKLIISYTGDTVKRVTKLIEHGSYLELGGITLPSLRSEIEWQFQT